MMSDILLRETCIRQMAEDAANRSQWHVEIPAFDLNIHPAIARDIARYLRGPFREAEE